MGGAVTFEVKVELAVGEVLAWLIRCCQRSGGR